MLVFIQEETALERVWDTQSLIKAIKSHNAETKIYLVSPDRYAWEVGLGYGIDGTVQNPIELDKIINKIHD